MPPLHGPVPIVQSLELLIIGRLAFRVAMLSPIPLSTPFPLALALRIAVSAPFSILVRALSTRSVAMRRRVVVVIGGIALALAVLVVSGRSVLVVSVAIVSIVSGALASSVSLRGAVHARV